MHKDLPRLYMIAYILLVHPFISAFNFPNKTMASLYNAIMVMRL